MSGKRKATWNPKATKYNKAYLSTNKKFRGTSYRSYNPGLSGRFEKKTSDIAVATYQVNTTGSFTLLHAPIPGSDYTNRIGRKTLAKNVYIRGRVQLENAALTTQPASSPAQQARMIVFIDAQPNGAAPAVTDLLNTASPASQLNLNNRDRFKIVSDDTFVFDPLLAATSFAVVEWSRTVSDVKCYNKLNVETVFNAGTAGTIADINSGALYMFWIGSEAAGAGTDTNAIVSTRVRYSDA